jgi:Predicted nucleotide-binding protein containing TIR-like domain
MANVNVFVGSSGAARNQAKLLIKDLQSASITFHPWWDAFTPTRTLLESLEATAKKVDAAILLFSPDFPGTIRGNSVALPNQNVMFEFGFYGRAWTVERCYDPIRGIVSALRSWRIYSHHRKYIFQAQLCGSSEQ